MTHETWQSSKASMLGQDIRLFHIVRPSTSFLKRPALQANIIIRPLSSGCCRQVVVVRPSSSGRRLQACQAVVVVVVRPSSSGRRCQAVVVSIRRQAVVNRVCSDGRRRQIIVVRPNMGGTYGTYRTWESKSEYFVSTTKSF